MDTWDDICDGEIIAKSIDQVMKCPFSSFQFRYKLTLFLAQLLGEKKIPDFPRESNALKVGNKYFYIFG